MTSFGQALRLALEPQPGRAGASECAGQEVQDLFELIFPSIKEGYQRLVNDIRCL
jgi:hypothetical protein